MFHALRFLPAVFFLSIATFGQDESTTRPTPPDPTVSKKVLTFRFDPMTKEELEAEVDSWLALLKQKSEQISQLEIDAIEGGTDTDNSLETLKKEKDEIIERTKLAIDALELKGGDVDTAIKYVAAVTEIKAGVGDIEGKLFSLKDWLTSRDGGVKIAIHILQFIGVMVIFWIIAFVASRVIRRAIEKQQQFSELLKDFINKTSRRLILFIGLIVALGTIGVNVGAALALIGGSAFIVGLALQDTLSNFANGVMLLIYRPFDVGSAVEVGGIKGKVASVSMVSTTILTFDNQKVLVPNKKVWGEVITNITGMTNRRVDLVFGIGYDDDISKAQEIIERAVAENELILDDPEPNIGVHELGDSSVNFRCWAWAKTDDYLTARTHLMRTVKEQFDAAGISIPFPQRDVHLFTVPNEGEEKNPA